MRGSSEHTEINLGSNDLLDDVTIRRTGVVYTVPIKIDQLKVQAVLDTGAEVTIISDKIFPQIQPTPPVVKEVNLRPAGRDMIMKGKIVGPVKISLGNKVYNEHVYVAPIEDKMLLGLGFLRKIGASAHLASDVLTIGNEKIPMKFGGSASSLKRIARITVIEPILIPPKTVARVPCKLNCPLSDYVVEPSLDKLPPGVIMPRTYHTGGESASVCLINMGDETVRVRPNKVIASASEATEAQPCDFISPNLAGVSRISCTPQIPEHMQDMINRAKVNLTEEEHKTC